MSLVYWDSMLFAYLLEKSPTFFPVTKAVHEAIRRRGDTICTSIFTVGEVLVGPRKMGSHSGAELVSQFFATGSIRLLPFDLETANQFSFVRAWTGVPPADAIHLASAAQAQVDVFLTNDGQLLSCKIPGIGRFAGLDPALLRTLFS